MPRYAKSVPFYSSKVPVPNFSISDEQWECLNTIFAGEIPAEVRAEMDDHCRRYLLSREAEIHSDDYSEAVGLVEKGHTTASAFYDLANRLLDNGKDSGTFASRRLEDFLEDKVLRINPAHLVVVVADSTGWESLLGNEANFALGLRMSRQLLCHIASEMHHAFHETRLALRSEEAGGADFTPGRAFAELVTNATRTFEAAGLAVSPGFGGNPSKFSRLMFALHAMLPEAFREAQMASATALAKRIMRIRQGDK